MSIEESFKEKLQTVYGQLLDENGIKYGDIEPGQLVSLEAAEDELAGVVAGWVRSAKPSVFDMNREDFIEELSKRTKPYEIFDNADRIYDYLEELFNEECGDSLLREWSFQWYCEQTKDDYKNIYNKWLGINV